MIGPRQLLRKSSRTKKSDDDIINSLPLPVSLEEDLIKQARLPLKLMFKKKHRFGSFAPVSGFANNGVATDPEISLFSSWRITTIPTDESTSSCESQMVHPVQLQPSASLEEVGLSAKSNSEWTKHEMDDEEESQAFENHQSDLASGGFENQSNIPLTREEESTFRTTFYKFGPNFSKIQMELPNVLMSRIIHHYDLNKTTLDILKDTFDAVVRTEGEIVGSKSTIQKDQCSGDNYQTNQKVTKDRHLFNVKKDMTLTRLGKAAINGEKTVDVSHHQLLSGFQSSFYRFTTPASRRDEEFK